MNVISRIRYAVDDRVSRYVFGNTLPLRRNLVGAKNALVFQRALGQDRSALDESIRATYREQAIYKVPAGTIDREVIARMSAAFDAAVADARQIRSTTAAAEFETYKMPYHGPADAVLYRHLLDVTASMPAVFEVWNEALTRIVRSCFGSNFFVKSHSAWRMYSLPAEIDGQLSPLIDRWHFDSGSTTRMRLLIALTPMSEQNGATELFDRQYTRVLVRKGFTPASIVEDEHRNDELIEQHVKGNPRVVRNTGPRGSAICFNPAFCLHHAGRRTPGSYRDMVQIDIRGDKQLKLPDLSDPPPTL